MVQLHTFTKFTKSVFLPILSLHMCPITQCVREREERERERGERERREREREREREEREREKRASLTADECAALKKD